MVKYGENIVKRIKITEAIMEFLKEKPEGMKTTEAEYQRIESADSKDRRRE